MTPSQPASTARRSCSSNSPSTTSARPPTCCALPTTRSRGTRRLRLLRMHPGPRRRHGGTVAQAIELWSRLARPNVMIKVPATAAGIPAIEELTAAGVNVNVTLLFSVERYEQVIDAYIAGLERRVAAGQPVDAIASVASFFVSRVDTKADALLPADSPCAGASRSPTPIARTPATARFAGRALACSAPSRRPPPAPAVGEHRNQEPRLLRRPLRRAADRARRRSTRCPRRRSARSPTTATCGRRTDADARRRRQMLRAPSDGHRPSRAHRRARTRGRALLLRLLPRAAQLHRDQGAR